MIRKSIGLLAGMLVTVAVYAAGAQLRADHPDTYTVKKGDTLWAISARFLSKPWLWPEIWQANPQVQNPHLIFPGDVLNLSFINGPHVGLQPRVHSEEAAVPAIPLDAVRTFLKEMRVLNTRDVEHLPYVVGFEEADLRGTVGKNVYVRNLHADPGQRFAIVRPTHTFRNFNGGKGRDNGADLLARPLDSDVSMVRTPWLEESRFDDHFGRGEDIGTEVSVIGTAEVLRTGDPTTLLLLDSTMEIRKGDRIVAIDEKPYDPYFYPHAPKSLPGNARVIAFADAYDAVGPHQVVALNIGSQDGVENGQTYSIYQPGEEIPDDVASNSWNRGTGQTVTLPQEFVGHVMVFRTFDRVAYGLIMDGIRPVHKHDKLELPE
ncbi:LysM domain-containing protein [Dyella solisilvae]|uniref:LysM domain-containing protein n=1 Tax=Dyella solisilvae TaxID=1920168 RepID=A0A370K8J8_9GAMM|nr:LysM domain-containing protein [Dyella solisilvae]RDI98978.1 LysM domain-containing protein [Dyella solisilvae]